MGSGDFLADEAEKSVFLHKRKQSALCWKWRQASGPNELVGRLEETRSL